MTVTPFWFYVGLHMPQHAEHFDHSFISKSRLANRKSGFSPSGDWIMDSAAFMEVLTNGGYVTTVKEYATVIRNWRWLGNLSAAVAQDYMCEGFILKRTGLTVADHQRLTIERYDALVQEDVGTYILPVLQGFEPEEYCRHLDAYGDRIPDGAYIGVGSLCKRNRDPREVFRVLSAIHRHRAGLRIHGFGLKVTALEDYEIVRLLATADSMAWSYDGRRINGKLANDWRHAKRFERRILRGVALGELEDMREQFARTCDVPFQLTGA